MTQMECLKEKLETSDTIVIGGGAGLPQDSHTVGNGSENIFRILKINMVSMICMREGSIHTVRWRNIGHTGAVILLSTAIWMRQNLYTRNCLL